MKVLVKRNMEKETFGPYASSGVTCYFESKEENCARQERTSPLLPLESPTLVLLGEIICCARDGLHT